MKLAYDLYSPSREDDDDPSKSPVILLHGRLDSRKTWKKLAPKIAEMTGRKVYCVDARNHGESPWSDEMDFEILSNDLDEFLNEHVIPKAILVGHSMGGKMAISFALRQPERVEKLFVEDNVVEKYSPSVKYVVGKMITLMRKSLDAIPPGADEPTAKKSVYDFVKSMYNLLPPESPSGFMFDADTLALKKVGSKYEWQANLDVLEDMLKNRSSQALSGAYTGDALFLYGTESFIDVENDESIVRYFPRAVKVPVQGAGHLIHQDHPDVFMDYLLKFIGCPDT